MNYANNTVGKVDRPLGTYLYDIRELRQNAERIVKNTQKGYDKYYSESQEIDYSSHGVTSSAVSSSIESSTTNETSTKESHHAVCSRICPRKKMARKATVYDEDNYALAGSIFSTPQNSNINDKVEGESSPSNWLKEAKCIYFAIFSVVVIPLLTGIVIIVFLLLTPPNNPTMTNTTMTPLRPPVLNSTTTDSTSNVSLYKTISYTGRDIFIL